MPSARDVLQSKLVSPALSKPAKSSMYRLSLAFAIGEKSVYVQWGRIGRGKNELLEDVLGVGRAGLSHSSVKDKFLVVFVTIAASLVGALAEFVQHLVGVRDVREHNEAILVYKHQVVEFERLSTQTRMLSFAPLLGPSWIAMGT